MKLDLNMDREALQKQVEECGSELAKLRKEQEELHKKRSAGFLDYYNSLTPIIKYIKENNYYFFHKDTDWQTVRGPIVGKDKYNNKIYCIENSLVVEVTNNGEGKKTDHRKFPQKL